MKIKSITLTNFKRFTNLTITDIKESSKLVLVVGGNGTGKSSLFDAFEAISNLGKENFNIQELNEYYRKDKSANFTISINTNAGMLTRNESMFRGNLRNPYSFYGRTSFRQIPKLTRTSLGQGGRLNLEKDTDRPKMYIEKDNRFEGDIEILTEKILKDFFKTNSSAEEIKNNYITPINNSLDNIFNYNTTAPLKLVEIIPPLEGKVAQINFQKGNSLVHYNYLSAGEKEVINILFNLLSRKHLYQDTIYFFDEIDLHLNTLLQKNFLKEIIENWIPENCQFWTASHSLGFIEYARQNENATIIDFSFLNFDIPNVITPETKNNLEVLEIAIPKDILSSILKDSTLVVAENKNNEYYNLALAEKGFLFLPANNNREVFLTIKGDAKMLGLRDKDYLKPDEVNNLKKIYSNLKVLDFYTFENYLYHPDNIEELNLNGFIKQNYIENILTQKSQKLLAIVSEIATARQTYVEFKDAIKDDKNIQPIIDALNTNDFTLYYPYFNMKNYYNKEFLKQFNLQPKNLAKTNWFKQQILSCLS